ncbi:MAG: glycerophosphodiester phosphodiesterase family protein [Desulfopila sp.]|nr:glycerophosphodiester phosphodiesterase family protein [Desulfopila sp.]
MPSLIFAGFERPDFIELPLLLTRDNKIVVFDDLLLHPATNVAEVFPDRSRPDGNFYLLDFDLFEIEQLSFRKDPAGKGNITMHPVAFTDALQTIARLGELLSHQFNILPVIKYPWFYTNEKKDISKAVLDIVVAQAESPESNVFLKCYDPDELQRVHSDLLPGLPVEVKLIQGIDHPGGKETMRTLRDGWEVYNYEWLFTRLGLRVVSSYAEGLSLVAPETLDEMTLQRVIHDSHSLKMTIFIDGSHIPPENLVTFSTKFLYDLNADGISLSTPAALRDSLMKSDTLSPLNPGQSESPADLHDTTISDNPEALIRRLQKAL